MIFTAIKPRFFYKILVWPYQNPFRVSIAGLGQIDHNTINKLVFHRFISNRIRDISVGTSLKNIHWK